MVIRKVQEAELDEMWSFVGRKKHPRWLWGALDHQTGRILAYVFGRREDRALLKLKALARALRDSPLLHRRLGCLSPALGSAPACGRQAEDATAGAETSHAAHADQTLSEKNHLLFQIRPDARYCDWAVHQPL